jgi:hypothetical protein
MPRIANWDKVEDSPRLRYRNRETGALATAHRLSSTRSKWQAALVYRGYKLWSRGFETKKEAASALRDKIRDESEPRLTCYECGEDVEPTHNEDGDNAVKYHYDCRECGYEGEARWVGQRAT